MAFIIDGSNYLGAVFPDQLRDPEGRMSLARRLLAFAHHTRHRVHLVFDGRASDDLAALTRGDDRLRLHIPPDGESADDVILGLVDRQKDRRRLVLVSNDRALRDFAREAGASSLLCREFEAQLKTVLRQRKAGSELAKPEAKPSSFEVGFWMDIFGQPGKEAPVNIALIGTGRLGTSLGRALAGRGFKIAGLYDKRPAAARRALRIIGRGRPAGSGADACRTADLVFLCVPDGELAATALELALAGIDWKGKIVLHASGALSSAVLAPLRCEGAATGSFHPAQSFARPDTPPTAFAGTTIAVEGDRRAAAAGRGLAASLGGRILRLRAADKARYHAACSMASNLFIPLFDLACSLLEEAGVSAGRAEAALLPLVEGTLANIRALGRDKALTGPIARGDAATAALHLKALPSRGAARDAYLSLGRRALDLAVGNGLGRREAAAIRRTLGRR